MRPATFVALCVSCLTVTVKAQPAKPGDSPENPKRITSKDKGPQLDPAAFAKTPFNSLPLFRTFRSFVSVCYATADTWVYADDDEQALYDAELTYPYPDFYKPTWGEVFDVVARQMRCSWSWNPQNRQFKFARSDAKPPFTIDLAEGWRSEDRGAYVWHAPKDQPFGMDVYDLGHYTTPAGEDPAAFSAKVREHVAMRLVRNWPDAPTAEKMSAVKVAGQDALHLKVDTPRPGGVWRQWSVLLDGHAFLIVSAMPKAKEAELVPAVEKMVASFKLSPPAVPGAN